MKILKPVMNRMILLHTMQQFKREITVNKIDEELKCQH